MRDGARDPHLARSPPAPILLEPKEMGRRRRVRGRGRREERKEPLTGDLEMCAEQGSSEEYKSQLGYPNTSKTILHISANTFGAGGPGQRQHSHTCTHTRVYTCTHHTQTHARAEPLRLPPPRRRRPPPPPLRLFCLRSLLPGPLAESAAKRGSKKFHWVQEMSSPSKTSGN